MICPECGKMLPDDAGFCVRCGENLNNPNAEVCKKTDSSGEKQGKENTKERTRVLTIIPDEVMLYGNNEEDADKSKNSGENPTNAEESPAPKRRRRKKPSEDDESEKMLPDKKQEEDTDDDDDEEESEENTSSKFTVISVILALLVCAGIVIYFFTQNSIRSKELQAQMTESETSETTEETTETTTEETTETEPPVETTVMTDAENNSYTIEIADNIPAKVVLDAGTLRVRAYPSTDSTILGQLANGEDVAVIGSCGEWYYISYGENTGFVFSEYIQTEEAQTEALSADNADDDSADDGDLTPEENVPAFLPADDGMMPVE